MLDLAKYQSIGAALKDALETFAGEVCLIEADREREKERLTYREFALRGHPLARTLQDAGFAAGARAAIVMTNQSKWLISAYAIFFRGGVLVPLDYKLTPDEQWQLLAHSGASVLVTEYPIWRQLVVSAGRAAATNLKSIYVTEVPANAELSGAQRWESALEATTEPTFLPRTRKDLATIVYSSGTGGRPKGCMMIHENYLEQCVALTSLYPFAPGFRYLSILPTNHAIDFMVGFFGPFICGAAVVHLRTLRPEFVREAFVKYKVTYVSLVPLVLKNLQKGLQARFDALTPGKRRVFQFACSSEQSADQESAALGIEPAVAWASACGVWRRTARDYCGRGVYGAPDAAIFLRFGNSGGEWLWADRSGDGDHGERPASVSRGYGGEAAAGDGGADCGCGCGRDWRDRCAQ